ncbi:MAG: Ig-like domain-containing protein [Paracoccaceae bacterium]
MTATAIRRTTQTLTLTAVSGAVNGTVALSGGLVTFTPTPGYTGSAQFTYTLSDGAGGIDTATVSLTVADNEAPTAANDQIAVDEDSIVTGNVLDNDDDPEGRELTAVLLSGPMQGVLTFSADGSFAYEADADLFDLATPGTVIEQTFTYQVSDGDGGVDQATATLFVTILDDGGTFHAGDSTPNVATGTDGGEDLVLGGAGDDALYGLDGADTIRGDDGDDRLYGGESADRLYGEADNDRLYGEDGADVLKGAGGDDRLDGGSGHDILRGGSGDDRLLGRAGDDTLNGGSGADAMDGGSGDDLLRGWTGNDRIKGAAGADTLKGEAGDDRIKGGSGGDLIKGGSGRDQIEGGEGLDTLIGGAGSDRFVFTLGEGADEVLDFTDGQDLLVMRGLDFAELSIAQSGDDTTISVEGAVVAVLLDVEVSALTARDFLF